MVDDLIDSTVSPVVPGVVSEVIDELHRQCVSSPRGQQKDALLSTALEVVDEMVQEIMEEEVWPTVGGGGMGVVLVECSQYIHTYIHMYVPMYLTCDEIQLCLIAKYLNLYVRTMY